MIIEFNLVGMPRLIIIYLNNIKIIEIKLDNEDQQKIISHTFTTIAYIPFRIKSNLILLKQ